MFKKEKFGTYGGAKFFNYFTYKEMSIILILFVCVVTWTVSTAINCSPDSSDASIVSKNLSTAADQFEVNRRILFYNTMTDTIMLEIQGRCSVEFAKGKFMVTCKVAPGNGPASYKKHYLGTSGNSLPIVEQLEPLPVDNYHHRVVIKPQSIDPDIDFMLKSVKK